MTEKEKLELKFLKLEVRARKEILKKIENPYRRLIDQAHAQREKRKSEVLAAREYKSIEEARDAQGYDCITEKEFEEIKRVFEKGEAHIENDLSPHEVAVEMLGEFINRLYTEMHSFENDIKPQIIRQQNGKKQKVK